jgi:hypothetical protein
MARYVITMPDLPSDITDLILNYVNHSQHAAKWEVVMQNLLHTSCWRPTLAVFEEFKRNGFWDTATVSGHGDSTLTGIYTTGFLQPSFVRSIAIYGNL